MGFKPQEAGFQSRCGPSDPGKLVVVLPILQTCKLRAGHGEPSELIPDRAGLSMPHPTRSAEAACTPPGCHPLPAAPGERQGLPARTGGPQTLEAAGLSSSPDSAAHKLCDSGQLLGHL